MNSKNDPVQKRLGDFIEVECPGCNFIGISGEGEVYVSFQKEDPDTMTADKKRIKDHFGSEIARLTTIVSVPLEEVKTLVEGLNRTLKDMEEEKPQLLNIGRF